MSSASAKTSKNRRTSRKRLIDVFDAADEEEASGASSSTAAKNNGTNENSSDHNNSRKRQRLEQGQPSPKQQLKLNNTKHPQKPLEGVIACLSGFTIDKKTKLHAVIENLGGAYTRVFDLDQNTHLITNGPNGAKYALASSSSKIQIVSPAWLIESARNGKLMSEKDYRVVVNKDNRKKKSPPPSRHALIQQIDELLSLNSSDHDNHSKNTSLSSLFECQNILLLGFDGNNKDGSDGSMMVKNKLGVLIRRGLGTIYWEMNDAITIMILHDNCDEKLHKAATLATAQHPNMPMCVSPLWIIETMKKKSLQIPSKFPPKSKTSSLSTARRASLGVNNMAKANTLSSTGGGKESFQKSSSSRQNTAPSSTAANNDASSINDMMLSISTHSQVFKGCLFSLVRIAPPDFAVDFDTQQQEKFIKRHGGQMLTLQLLDAMKKDSKKKTTTTRPIRKKCHVVCWGATPTSSTTTNQGTVVSTSTKTNQKQQQQQYNQRWLMINPVLSTLQRLSLCDIVYVTPFWLQSCVQIEKRINANTVPFAFQPQPFPIRKALLLDDHAAITTKKTSTNDNPTAINIAMTGFQWMERIALSNMIREMGGTFHENLNQKTTHLLCKEKATGLKLEKAIQWNIKIVKAEWLYHIVQYGYSGAAGGITSKRKAIKYDARNEEVGEEASGGTIVGCESRFFCS